MNGSYGVNDSTDHEVYASKIIMVRQMSEVHSQEVNGLDIEMVVHIHMQCRCSCSIDGVAIHMQLQYTCSTDTV